MTRKEAEAMRLTIIPLELDASLGQNAVNDLNPLESPVPTSQSDPNIDRVQNLSN